MIFILFSSSLLSLPHSLPPSLPLFYFIDVTNSRDICGVAIIYTVARIAEAMPLGVLPRPEDIADAVAFLAGAPAITGQTLFVDGGASLKSFDRDFVYL